MEWEGGQTQPTLRQLENLAKKTMTPFGYFFLHEPPEEQLPIPDFRTLRDRPVRRPSPNLLETIHTMQMRQDWMRDHLVEESADPLPFIASVTLESSPLEAARRVREAVGMTSGWAGEHASWTAALLGLRRSVEAIGVMVVINGVVRNNNNRKLDPGEFRAFVLCDSYAPLIFINGADFKSAQMFTLAHELAHLWLGRDGVFDLLDLQPGNSDVERFCNAVAAEALIYSVELQESWRDIAHAANPIQALANRFKVSPIVAARRALDLQLIQKVEFFSFLRTYEQNEERKATAKKSGDDSYQTQEGRIGRRFGEAVIRPRGQDGCFTAMRTG